MSDVPGYLVAQGYQLGTILGLIRCYLGQSWIPGEVGTEAGAPPCGLDGYFPGTRIVPKQPFGYLAVPIEMLAAKGAGMDGRAAGAGGASQRPLSFAAALRMLPTYLADGYPTASVAARLADVSERTLARRLGAENLTFGQLIDEVRCAEASHLLSDPTLHVGDVARAVGFDDQSNFTRMFRRIAGVSPGDYRLKVVH